MTQVNVRATPEQIKQWRAQATTERRKLSDWVRFVLDERCEKPKKKA
jgi:hypothetical protein